MITIWPHMPARPRTTSAISVRDGLLAQDIHLRQERVDAAPSGDAEYDQRDDGPAAEYLANADAAIAPLSLGPHGNDSAFASRESAGKPLTRV